MRESGQVHVTSLVPARYPAPVIDPELLAILACPASRQPLKEVDAAELGALNEKIATGSLTNVGGKPIKEALEAALVCADGSIVYPVRQGIPVLLPEEGFKA
ncbi:MAG: hypothetical protein ACI8QS_002610 [Planctomycetota bacterium]|jgi:uncharacterized protein YbaR (Trm112 family)